MVTSFRVLLSAGVFSLAVCDWCDEHHARQIWDEKNNPHMIPSSWYESGGEISAFTQDPQGYRYFLGHASGGSTSVVMSSPTDDYTSYSLVVELGPNHASSAGLAVSREGLRLFIVYGPNNENLQECPTTPISQLGKCTTIFNGVEEEDFDGLVYDDDNHVLYGSHPFQNIIVAFSQDPNGNWKGERRVAGNGHQEADLTGLNTPGGLSLYQGDLFIIDAENNRIVRWTPTARAANTEYTFDDALGLFAVSVYGGKIYYMDVDAYAVYTLDVDDPNAPKQIVAGECGQGAGDNQLSGGLWTSVFLDAPANAILILDDKRVVEWNAGG